MCVGGCTHENNNILVRRWMTKMKSVKSNRVQNVYDLNTNNCVIPFLIFSAHVLSLSTRENSCLAGMKSVIVVFYDFR